MNRTLRLLLLPIFALFAADVALAQTYVEDVGDAEVRARTTDSTLVQQYTGHYGWSFMLPEEKVAKFNKLGSKVNEGGQSEVVNFMLRGGRGGVTIRYYTEQRMLPAGYSLLDSAMHFYEYDSVGRNGTIYRRIYVLTDQTIEMEVMLTEKGAAELGSDIAVAIFDSFLPPDGATYALEEWRYGRNPEDYEVGRY